MRAGDDMPRGERRANRPRRTGRGRILLVVVAIGLFILITTLRSIASFYTDYLWFQSIGQTGVWRGVLGTKLTLAFVFIALFFVLLWVNLFIADRIAPKFRPAGPEEELIERYHELVGRRRVSCASWWRCCSPSSPAPARQGSGKSGCCSATRCRSA